MRIEDLRSLGYADKIERVGREAVANGLQLDFLALVKSCGEFRNRHTARSHLSLLVQTVALW